MAGAPWSREDIEWLCAHPFGTLEQANADGRCLGRSYHGFRLKLAEIAEKSVTVHAGGETVQIGKKHQTPEQRLAYFAKLHEAAMLRSDGATRTDETEWYAPSNGLPVGIMFAGDFHMGSHGVDYPELFRHMELLRDTDGLYGIGMGDYHEGVSIHSKAAPALYSGIYNSGDEQEEAVRLALGIPPREKWIVWLKGNHDAWIERHAGLSRTERLAEEMGVEHFGEGGGTVFANVGNQRLAVGVRHNHSGNSQLNTSNAQRRMVDSWLSWDALHVACLAHFHFNDLHLASRHGKRVVYLRSGTFKTHDSYAKGGGFLPELGCPLVILLPDQEKVLAYRGDDLEYGLDQLTMLRERYAGQLAA